MNAVISYFKQTQSQVKDIYRIKGIAQGPQGACSPQSIFALETLQFLLNTWTEKYIHLGVIIKAVSTKVNENFFAQVRMENATPDVLEFSRLFPVVTTIF